GARDRLRQVKADAQPVTVLFAAGTYLFEKPVTFTEQDSGSANAPISYRAQAAAEVRFTGGRSVSGWAPVTDEAQFPHLPAEARSRVLVADLRTQGITDFGELTVHGFAIRSQLAEAELFLSDAPMTLARWPNEGFRGIQRKHSQERIEVDTDRVARWVDEPEPWVFAYWHHDWAEMYEPIVGIDPTQQIIERSDKVKPRYGITPGRARWYALNLLSELDSPGEYYLDRQNGMLYFWPPAPGGATVLSQGEGIVRAENLSHVTFQGFVFECCRGTAITLKDGTDCHIVGCTIRNVGHRAVVVNGGAKHEVYGCDIYHCGEGGIAMSGGDRPTLTPAGHNAENNHVHHYSRRARTYKTGITVSGVGNRIAHNLIHDGPHMALSAGGNDHIVEYNEIHNVVYESGDAGAFYVGRDWTQRGTVIRYNYWHQIVGAAGHGGMTIYLDDQHSGHTIHGNLFERCSRAVFIGGGDDNIVTNNVFLDCWKAAHIDNRGMGWQKAATDDPNGTLRTRLRAMPYGSDLWRKRYPTLPGILEDEPNIPKRNVFARNISAGGIWDDIHQGTREYQTVENNLVFDDDEEWIRLIKDQQGRPVRMEFRDPTAVAAIGFEPLPLEKIGVYRDERRASWPVTHQVRLIDLPEPPKPRPQADLAPNPVHTVARNAARVTIDGRPDPAEWARLGDDTAMLLTVDYTGALVDPPARGWLAHDGEALRVAMSTPLAKRPDLGTRWGGSEAVELALRAEGPDAETLVLRGYAAGKWETCADGGAGQQALARLERGVQYAAQVSDNACSAEWSIPFASLGVAPGDRLRFNLTVRRGADDLWVMWRPTKGNSYLVDRVGTIELAP
ncbi:MAG: right-handed parallel beta-helix repeat-containing protein, partial [Armatimonadota bacterium]